MNILPVGADMLHADGQTDRQTGMMKLIVAFTIIRKELTSLNNNNTFNRILCVIAVG